ncbi:MAG: isopentenyl-diphosphate Delta-isomerase [Rhodothermales bacterium]|nr:isopentenyl-diphosphate Delta-isomerase [Rhodothermales bacterium]MBO6778596.1 isopentenyl-diphosphate Delta-isomerase [Rhodothermales bacterium]
MQENVVLVDPEDRPLGEMEKMEAHRRGVLHRAFSVFVFNRNGELLLQRRALDKYHSRGLWSNTCCSHPRPGETVEEAAVRRLREEMGMRCELEKSFTFVYRSTLDRGLIEHEYDHVLVGWCDTQPKINPHEVAEWRYASPAVIRQELIENAGDYTSWFRICFERAAHSAHNWPTS